MQGDLQWYNSSHRSMSNQDDLRTSVSMSTRLPSGRLRDRAVMDRRRSPQHSTGLLHLCGVSRVLMMLMMMVFVLVQGPSPVTAEISNVAFEWTTLLNTLICPSHPSLTSSVQAQLHLAQWHALLALKHTGGDTTEDAVVAFASHRILAHYFSWLQATDVQISPLLDQQLEGWALPDQQENLAKRIGEAVANRLIAQRSPAGEFTLRAVKKALNANPNPAPGVFRFYDTSKEAREEAIFFFTVPILWQPFVIPHPVEFVKEYLGDVKPLVIPSKEWDENWKSLKDIGRADWSGRTAEMNLLSNLFACGRSNSKLCHREQAATAAAQSSLPPATSLYDSVVLLAKISVSMHDAAIAQATMKYGYWFWRPTQAYRAGDSHHAPIPNWEPYAGNVSETEFPSGTVTLTSSGARPLQNFFGQGKKVAFTLAFGGTFNCSGFVNQPIPTRNYTSLEEYVNESKLARMYAGAHFQKSVDAGAIVGSTVADYVEAHWTHTAPSGVLPDPAFLLTLAKVPKHSGNFSPVHYDL